MALGGLEQRDKVGEEAALEPRSPPGTDRLAVTLRELSVERLDEFCGGRATTRASSRSRACMLSVSARPPRARGGGGRRGHRDPARGPPADPFVFHAAIDLLIRTERYDAAAPFIDAALETTRRSGCPRRWLRFTPSVRCWESDAGLSPMPTWTCSLHWSSSRRATSCFPHVFAVAMLVALERGDLERAQELAGRQPARLERERLFVDRYLVSRGRVRTAAGDARGGLADFERCAEFLELYDTPALISWRPHAVAALMQVGDEDRARTLAREEIAAARRYGAPGELLRALRSGGVAFGGDEGLTLLEEAVTVAERSSARLEAAHALADLGDALVQRRQRREGREALRRALTWPGRAGPPGSWNAFAAAWAPEAAGRRGWRLTGVEALTPAERRVCELAAGERTNPRHRQQLFVTEKTVELHLTNAYRKLGIRSRFQLGLRARDRLAQSRSRRAARPPEAQRRYRPGVQEQVRTAEVIAALSLATDLAIRLPLEHGLESTLVAMRLGERLGVDPETAMQTVRRVPAVLRRLHGRRGDRGGALRRRSARALRPGDVRVPRRADARPGALARGAGADAAGASRSHRLEAARRAADSQRAPRRAVRGR